MLLHLPGYIYGGVNLFVRGLHCSYVLFDRYINMLLPLPGYIYGGVNLFVRVLHSSYVLFDNKIH